MCALVTLLIKATYLLTYLLTYEVHKLQNNGKTTSKDKCNRLRMTHNYTARPSSVRFVQHAARVAPSIIVIHVVDVQDGPCPIVINAVLVGVHAIQQLASVTENPACDWRATIPRYMLVFGYWRTICVTALNG